MNHREEYDKELAMYIQHFQRSDRVCRFATRCRWADLDDPIKEFWLEEATRLINNLRTDVPFNDRQEA